MGNYNNEQRIKAVIEKLLNETDAEKHLNELVLFGYKKDFNKFINIIHSQVEEIIDWMDMEISLNPKLDFNSFPSMTEGIRHRGSIVNLLKNRIVIPDDQDIKPELKKGLTEAERNFTRDRVKDILQFLLENNVSQIDKINYLKAQITGRLAHDEDSPYRRFFIKTIEREIELLEKFSISQTKQTGTATATESETIETKPILKPEAVQTVFEIIKDFFSTEQQAELRQVIETGNKANKKLLFKDNGNRLTDTFKKLIEHDFITGCQKQDLIAWVVANFNYTYRNKVKEYTIKTVKSTISENKTPCKNPLINVENNKIRKSEQAKTKKM